MKALSLLPSGSGEGSCLCSSDTLCLHPGQTGTSAGSKTGPHLLLPACHQHHLHTLPSSEVKSVQQVNSQKCGAVELPLCFASAPYLSSHMLLLGRLKSSVCHRAAAPQVVPAQEDQHFTKLKLLPDSELTHIQP